MAAEGKSWAEVSWPLSTSRWGFFRVTVVSPHQKYGGFLCFLWIVNEIDPLNLYICILSWYSACKSSSPRQLRNLLIWHVCAHSWLTIAWNPHMVAVFSSWWLLDNACHITSIICILVDPNIRTPTFLRSWFLTSQPRHLHFAFYPKNVPPGQGIQVMILTAPGSGWNGSHHAFPGHLWWGSKARGSCVAWWQGLPWPKKTHLFEWMGNDEVEQFTQFTPQTKENNGMFEEICWDVEQFLLVSFQKWEDFSNWHLEWGNSYLLAWTLLNAEHDQPIRLKMEVFLKISANYPETQIGWSSFSHDNMTSGLLHFQTQIQDMLAPD